MTRYESWGSGLSKPAYPERTHCASLSKPPFPAFQRLSLQRGKGVLEVLKPKPSTSRRAETIFRCHASTVSGFTITSADRQAGHECDSQVQKNRSVFVNRARLTEPRRMPS